MAAIFSGWTVGCDLRASIAALEASESDLWILHDGSSESACVFRVIRRFAVAIHVHRQRSVADSANCFARLRA